ncbi:MAG: F0F1 ATP synthase subunit B, partial [Candidatus Omnitrophica bacterium]|nr:F0F1 ATP synthase subunit B [Candidatus Omnitrophota bacterium]
LLGVLIKFLFKPLLSIMDKRAASIEKTLKDAENSRKQANERLEDAQEALEKTSVEIIRMKESSRLQADEARRSVIEDAKKEGLRIIEGSKRDVDKEVRMARKSLGEEIAGFSIRIAEKLLKREIKNKDHAKLINDSIKEFTNE